VGVAGSGRWGGEHGRMRLPRRPKLLWSDWVLLGFCAAVIGFVSLYINAANGSS
jgi:hypothetical protein